MWRSLAIEGGASPGLTGAVVLHPASVRSVHTWISHPETAPTSKGTCVPFRRLPIDDTRAQRCPLRDSRSPYCAGRRASPELVTHLGVCRFRRIHARPSLTAGPCRHLLRLQQPPQVRLGFDPPCPLRNEVGPARSTSTDSAIRSPFRLERKLPKSSLLVARRVEPEP